MQIGPACYSVGGSRSLSVVGDYNPWQRNMIVQQQQAVLDPQPNRVVTSDVNPGRRLFTMEPLQKSYWMTVDVYPVGSLLFAAGTQPPTENELAGGVKYTPAQLRVRWAESPSRTRTVDLDIGAGISLTFPPSQQIEMDLLVPDPDFVDVNPDSSINSPFEFDPKAFRFATTVIAKATCVYSPGPPKGRLSQRVYVDGVFSGAPATRLVRLPQGTRNVILDGSIGSASAPIVTGTITAFLAQTFTPEPAPPVLVPGGPVVSVEIPGLFRGISAVPNNQNILGVNIPAGFAADMVVISDLDVG